MKRIALFVLLFISLGVKGQVYQVMTQYGYETKRMNFDSTLQIPTVCGVPTLKTVILTNKKSAIAFDSCNNRFYTYNPKTQTWSTVGGIDTTSLSNRIELRVKYTDTATMLIPYLRKQDTSSLSSRIELRVKYTDTGFMLTPYLRKSDTNSLSSRIDLRVKYTDTATMLTNYFNKVNYGLSRSGQTLSVDTSVLSNKYLRIIDTANKFVSSVTKLNDSTIQVVKDGTTTNITLSPSTTVTAATRLVTTVYNNSGSTISKGSVVYINGRHSSNLPTIAVAQANTEANSYKTFALVLDDITNGNSGTVVQAGNITGLNLPTSSYADGDIVFLSPTVAGGYTTTKPIAPNHIVKLGSVTRAHPSAGSIEVKIENGWQLDELSDVLISAVPNDSTLLQFSRVDSLWHDVSVVNAIGSKYIKPSDTANMLSKYLRKTDTATLSARIDLKQNQLNGTGFVKASGTTISYDNSTYLLASSYDYLLATAYQALGSTIKGFNLAVPTITNATTALNLTSQQMRVVAYYLPQAATITGVKFYQATQGSYTGNNYNGVGLYTYSGGTLTLVASTTNDANFWTSAQGWVTKPFSSTYSAAAGIYYIGFLYCQSAQTTAPAITQSALANGNGFQTVDFTNSAKIQGALSTQTSLPSSSNISSFGANTGNPLILLY